MIPERTVMASAFKEHCLTLLDQVARDHVPLVVTKRGRPVARVVPIDDVVTGRATMGSVRLFDDEDEAYFSTGAPWESSG